MRAITFKNPPVIEVTCGTQFTSLKPLQTVDLGSFWEAVKARFPLTQDQPPLPDIQEPGFQAQEQIIDLPLMTMPRVWMIAPDQHELLQLQVNRFHYNWRRLDQKTSYPRFEKIYEAFQAQYSVLESWARSRGKALQDKRFELTYINHISKENGLRDPGAHYELLRCFNRIDGKVLNSPEGMWGETVFRLPDKRGTLHISIKQGARKTDNSPVLVVELTARGNAEHVSRADWFPFAHYSIVQGFVDLTTEYAHKEWGLEQ